MDKSKILLIVPAYNESKVIDETIQGILDEGYNLVIIDDCSTDDTYEKCLRHHCYVLRHMVNLGQGAAIQTGFSFGLSQTSYEVFVTFDADGQHRVEDVEPLVNSILTGQAEVALGSRFLGTEPENMPKLRRFVIKMAIGLTRLISRIKVTDTHNGLRAFSRKSLSQVEITHNDMSHASEILDIIHKNRISFIEVPVKITYSDYSLKKGQNLLNGVNILWDLIFKENTK